MQNVIAGENKQINQFVFRVVLLDYKRMLAYMQFVIFVLPGSYRGTIVSVNAEFIVRKAIYDVVGCHLVVLPICCDAVSCRTVCKFLSTGP